MFGRFLRKGGKRKDTSEIVSSIAEAYKTLKEAGVPNEMLESMTVGELISAVYALDGITNIEKDLYESLGVKKEEKDDKFAGNKANDIFTKVLAAVYHVIGNDYDKAAVLLAFTGTYYAAEGAKILGQSELYNDLRGMSKGLAKLYENIVSGEVEKVKEGKEKKDVRKREKKEEPKIEDILKKYEINPEIEAEVLTGYHETQEEKKELKEEGKYIGEREDEEAEGDIWEKLGIERL